MEITHLMTSNVIDKTKSKMNNSLLGVLLNVSIIKNPPHATLPLNLELLRALQLSLEFQYVLKEAEDWGLFNNGTGKWNGMIRHLVDGEAEFAITDAADIDSRRAVVDFSLSFANFKHVAMHRKQSFRGDKFGLVRPFKGHLWVAILCWGIVLCLIMFLPRLVGHVRLQNQKYSPFYINEINAAYSLGITSFVLMPFSVLCGKAVPTVQPLPFYRIVVYSGFVVGIVLNAAFSAVLVSFLSIESYKSSLAYTSGRTFVYDPTDDKLALIEEKMQGSPITRFNEDYRKSTKLSVDAWNSKSKQNILQGSWIYLGTDWTVNALLAKTYTTSEHCSIGVIVLPIGSQPIGLMIRKNSPYIRPINNVILRVMECGLNDVWIKRYIPSRSPVCGTRRGYAPITLSSVIVSLYVMLFGLCVSILVLLVELFYVHSLTKASVIPD